MFTGEGSGAMKVLHGSEFNPSGVVPCQDPFRCKLADSTGEKYCDWAVAFVAEFGNAAARRVAGAFQPPWVVQVVVRHLVSEKRNVKEMLGVINWLRVAPSV